MYFSHICHFRPMTQPNPLKTQIFDPFPTQPNPTQPAGQPNPWTTLIGPVCGFVTAGGRCPNLTTASARAVFASL